MTTEQQEQQEQWTPPGGGCDSVLHADGVWKTKVVREWAVSSDSANGVHFVRFDPTPTEARAILRMPMRPESFTREEVHAEIRARGTVEECELITPVRDDMVCPGCGSSDPADLGGSVAWSRHGQHGWHQSCLRGVRARTEHADPEPAWVAIARAYTPPGCGFSWELETIYWSAGEAWDYWHGPTFAAAGEKARRHLVSTTAVKLGLPDPYGEQETREKGSLCIACLDPIETGRTHCGECCTCTSDSPSPCPDCGGMDEDGRGPVAHEGRTDVVGPTNGLGLPRMPERKKHTQEYARDPDPIWRLKNQNEQPLGEFLAQREAHVKGPAEPPRVGDLVEWRVVHPPAGDAQVLRGVVRHISDHGSHMTVRGTARHYAVLAEECTVLQRREER